MANCYECSKRRTIAGSCHSSCSFDFNGVKLPDKDPHGVKNGWCYFPFNFDPIWLGECEGFAAKESGGNIK